MPAHARVQEPYAKPMPSATQIRKANRTFFARPERFQRSILSRKLMLRRAFVGRRPKSTYRITPAGRKSLVRYLDAMRQLIDAVDSAGR